MNKIEAMHLESGDRGARRRLSRYLNLKWADFKEEEQDALKKATNVALKAAEIAHAEVVRAMTPVTRRALVNTTSRLDQLLSIQERIYS